MERFRTSLHFRFINTDILKLKKMDNRILLSNFIPIFFTSLPGAFSPGVKRQGREADDSPPASAEIKKMWIYISTPSYAFMA
jgi:hypothetical protein